MLLRLSAICTAALLCLPAVSQTTSFTSTSFNASGQIAAHGDFNRDGREDLVEFATDGFDIALSNGDGSYGTPVHHTVPSATALTKAVVGDFNNDGKLDLVVLSATPRGGTTQFYLYFGNGDGTFKSPVTYDFPTAIWSMAAADVNKDGKTDLLILMDDASGNTIVRTYFANGDGGFTAGPITSGVLAQDIMVGDFDGDGNTDIFTYDCDEGCSMRVNYGDGTGAFPAYTTAGDGDVFFVVADVNGDGKSDILGGLMEYSTNNPNFNMSTKNISIHYGQSGRTLKDATVATANCSIWQLSVADYNGDGIPDIMDPEIPCDGSSNPYLALIPGRADGTFGPEQRIFDADSRSLFELKTLRANRDTKPDIAFVEQLGSQSSPTYTMELLQNRTSGSFPTCAPSNSNTFGLNVCYPAAGTTVTSPVRFSAAGTGDTPMRKVEVWVDGSKQVEQLAHAFSDYSFLDANVPMSSGTHNVTLYAAGWDNSLQSKSFTVTVGSSSGGGSGGGGGSCSAPSADGINVCSPASGSSVGSPVAINAAATVSGTIYRFELWEGSTKLASVSNSTTMQTSVNLGSGTHTLTFVARNTAGTRWTRSVTFTVTSGSGGGTGGMSCDLPSSYGIDVCSPANGSTLGSPTTINATANVSGTIYRFEIWEGSTKLDSVANSNRIETTANFSSGKHTLVFVAKNTSGTEWKQSVTFTVGSASATTQWSAPLINSSDNKVGSVDIDTMGNVTASFSGAPANTGIPLQFCEFTNNSEGPCITVATLTTDASGNATQTFAFPYHGNWSGQFQLSNGSWSAGTESEDQYPPFTYLAQLVPANGVNGTQAGSVTDPIRGGTLTLSGSTIAISVTGALPNTTYSGDQGPMGAASQTYATDPLTTNANGDVNVTHTPYAPAGWDFSFAPGTPDGGGFQTGFKIP